MKSRYLHTLEFDKILARLAAHAAFSASEELARLLEPATDPEEIARRQGETTEARALLDQHSEMNIGGARDVRPLTQNARIGALLSPGDLLEVRQTLLSARTLRRALSRLNLLYPRLAARAALLEEVPQVVDAVARAINDRGEVTDSASSELARIRHELTTVRARLMVYAIYWQSGDRFDRTNYGAGTGQNLLAQVTEGTGGTSYWQGTGNPVSLVPYFADIDRRLNNQYELEFMPLVGDKPQMQTIKLTVSAHAKVTAPQEVYVHFGAK